MCLGSESKFPCGKRRGVQATALEMPHLDARGFSVGVSETLQKAGY